MDEEQKETEEQSKISLPEGIFITPIVLGMDGIELLVALTGYGITVGEVINLIGGAAFEIYIFLRGARGTRILVTWGIGMAADGVTSSAFPIKTITWFITWYLFNHPKALAKAGGVAKIAEKVVK